MRRVQAVTAVSLMAAGLTRQISQFMLLGLQALAMHCWSHSRRTVFSRSVWMNGLSMDTAEDDILEKVSGTCKDELREAPLMIYWFVCTRDKGHGADTLIHGHQEQIYKCAAPHLQKACLFKHVPPSRSISQVCCCCAGRTPSSGGESPRCACRVCWRATCA